MGKVSRLEKEWIIAQVEVAEWAANSVSEVRQEAVSTAMYTTIPGEPKSWCCEKIPRWRESMNLNSK